MATVNDPTAPFPPKAYLGFGLDFTSIMPTDIQSATANLKNATKIIDIPGTTSNVSFPSGVTWGVPSSVDASSDVGESATYYDTYMSGSKAATEIESSLTIAAKYMAVSGSSSGGYGISKAFQDKYAYALLDFQSTQIQARIDGWADYIREPELWAHAKSLPAWDSTNKGVIGQFRNFFDAYGSHVIVAATYGARFQLQVHTDNSSSSVNENFSANLSVRYNGLMSGGSVDTSVKDTKEFSQFQESAQQYISCKGGDTGLGTYVQSNFTAPDIWSQYQKWQTTANTNPDVMSFETTSIWDVMSAAYMSDVATNLNNAAQNFENAFNWIVANPLQHLTVCRFTVSSDWGEFGLLTPSAFIIDAECLDTTIDPSNYVLQSTKIQFGREHSFDYKRDIQFQFTITNDGSPVDFMLSHGSNGSTKGHGSCSVIIQSNNYLNDSVGDNNWNSLFFYQKQVNPAPVPSFAPSAANGDNSTIQE